MKATFTREAVFGASLARAHYADLDKVLVTQSAWEAFVRELARLANVEDRLREQQECNEAAGRDKPAANGVSIRARGVA